MGNLVSIVYNDMDDAFDLLPTEELEKDCHVVAAAAVRFDNLLPSRSDGSFFNLEIWKSHIPQDFLEF